MGYALDGQLVSKDAAAINEVYCRSDRGLWAGEGGIGQDRYNRSRSVTDCPVECPAHAQWLSLRRDSSPGGLSLWDE